MSGIYVNPKRHLTKEDYFKTLHLLKSRIEKGLPFSCEDSTTIGDKYTTCSWGFCSDDPITWPDPNSHTWPDQFLAEGRVAPLELGEGQKCHFDTQPQPKGMIYCGCFYRCAIFQSKKNSRNYQSEEFKYYVLSLIQGHIEEIENCKSRV